MIARRSLMQAAIGLIGTTASAPIALGRVSGLSVEPNQPTEDVWEVSAGPPREKRYDLASKLEDEKYRRHRMKMPPHIETMKSWSPVFKASVRNEEERELEAIIEALRRDEEVAKKIMAVLGVLP